MTIEKENYHIIVVLAQVMGDNLGLNGILGYVESFNAIFPCRLCKIKRQDYSTTYYENEALFRTLIDNNCDVATDNLKMTGIKASCCYNRLPTYHVRNNYYFDIIHDLLEEVCSYVLQTVLAKLICDKKYFTLDQLNDRLLAYV